MSFKAVLRSLQDVFPQVDLRILKAVAIEHSKDVDAAVEFVLSEVLPALAEATQEPKKLDNTEKLANASSEVEMQDTISVNQGAKEENASLLPGSSVTHESDFYTRHSYPAPSSSPIIQSFGSNSNKEVDNPNILLIEDVVLSIPPLQISSVCEKVDVGDYTTDALLNNSKATTSMGSAVNVQLIPDEDPEEHVLSLFTSSELEELLSRGLPQAHTRASSNLEINDSVPEDNLKLLDCGDPSDEVNFDSLIGFESTNLENDMSSPAEKPILETAQSCNVVKMDILEDFIADLKSNKETLVSALESACSMMKAVELQEDRTKQAKEEATKAGHDILVKAEDMRQFVAHAKGTNAMQAGEVYGERAMLAAKARELQSRLVSLLDEKDMSLSVVQRIQQNLEARLAAANAEEAAAEHEKLEREEAAQKILKEQESIMDGVSYESKILQEDAEENARLLELLMDRGHLVDKLQGELSAISEDISLLRDRVDERLTLQKSSSQSRSSSSSSCSSPNRGSSLSDQIANTAGSGENYKDGAELSSCKQLETDENEGIGKAFSDDDWEIF